MRPVYSTEAAPSAAKAFFWFIQKQLDPKVHMQPAEGRKNWANVVSRTSSRNLSDTTIKSITNSISNPAEQ